MAKNEKELKNLLMRVGKENEKAGLKLNIQKQGHGIQSLTSWQIEGESGSSDIFYSWALKITADSDCSHEIKTLAPFKQSCDKPIQHIKKQRHHFANKGLYSQSYGFSSSHFWMWELDHKEGWTLKNWGFQIMVLGEDS